MMQLFYMLLYPIHNHFLSPILVHEDDFLWQQQNRPIDFSSNQYSSNQHYLWPKSGLLIDPLQLLHSTSGFLPWDSHFRVPTLTHEDDPLWLHKLQYNHSRNRHFGWPIAALLIDHHERLSHKYNYLLRNRFDWSIGVFLNAHEKQLHHTYHSSVD